MRERKRVIASIQYDGSGYHGLVRQPNLKTIESTLGEAFFLAFNENINIVVAGRTDAGVHAIDQRIAFKTFIEVEKIAQYWNKSLPKSILINWVKKVNDDSFHVRHSVKLKTYRYKMKRDQYINPFNSKFFTEIKDSLKAEAFTMIAPVFIGKLDYTSVSKLESGINPIREIISIDIIDTKEGIEIVFKGRSFLRYMIRKIVSVMISFASGEITIEEVREKMDKKMHFENISPPNGLYLEKVEY